MSCPPLLFLNQELCSKRVLNSKQEDGKNIFSISNVKRNHGEDRACCCCSDLQDLDLATYIQACALRAARSRSNKKCFLYSERDALPSRRRLRSRARFLVRTPVHWISDYMLFLAIGLSVSARYRQRILECQMFQPRSRSGSFFLTAIGLIASALLFGNMGTAKWNILYRYYDRALLFIVTGNSAN